MWSFDYSDELKTILQKLYKKDKKKYEQIVKKIEEILLLSENDINYLKNLRNDMSDLKRVHIGKTLY